MELCSDNHREVAYEGRNCPVCEILNEHKDEVDGLQEKISSLEDEIVSLKDDISSLEGDK